MKNPVLLVVILFIVYVTAKGQLVEYASLALSASNVLPSGQGGSAQGLSAPPGAITPTTPVSPNQYYFSPNSSSSGTVPNSFSVPNQNLYGGTVL